MSSQKASRPKRMIRRVVIALSCVVIVGLVVSWVVAGALVAPRPRLVGNPPQELNAVAFDAISDSGSLLSGWHTRPESCDGVIVLLHGMGGSRLSMLDRAKMLHDAGYATVMVDLQAHGESPGGTITVGHLEKHDVRAAVDFARRMHPEKPIGIIAVSLGGAAALLASPLQIDAMILESVYPDIHNAIHNRVAHWLGPFSSIPTSLLLIQLQLRLGISPDELRPIDHLPDIECPVFIASGTEDFHTTRSETRAMFSAARKPKRLWLVDGAAHVDLQRFAPLRYRQQVVGFLDRCFHNDFQESIE
ncbi:MAG: alpha/beta fold hydrolase [Planctomycetota bacterium]